MENLQVIARWKIHDGNLESFKELANKCLAVSKAKDKDTLQYDWYFSENQKECVLIEKFPDSNALLAHLDNIGDLWENSLPWLTSGQKSMENLPKSY